MKLNQVSANLSACSLESPVGLGEKNKAEGRERREKGKQKGSTATPERGVCRGAEGMGVDRTINPVQSTVVIIACQPCLTPCHPPSKESEKNDSPISAPSRKTMILPA